MATLVTAHGVTWRALYMGASLLWALRRRGGILRRGLPESSWLTIGEWRAEMIRRQAQSVGVILSEMNAVIKTQWRRVTKN